MNYGCNHDQSSFDYSSDPVLASGAATFSSSMIGVINCLGQWLSLVAFPKMLTS